jgi:hypothetical protein
VAETFKTAASPVSQTGWMTIDLPAARAFMATHARVLDRRRFLHLLGEGEPGDLLAAIGAYRNSDGGYGWGAEPDLRSPESQPGGALHALEVFDDIAPATSHRAVELCDWLGSASLADGGLPFALPVGEAVGCAPFWVEADPAASSLHITAALAAAAHRIARHDPAIATHPWLIRASQYCLDAIAKLDRPSHALELRYALDFLDAVADQHAEALTLIGRLGAAIPASGCIHVDGGTDEEMMRPLDSPPHPTAPYGRYSVPTSSQPTSNASPRCSRPTVAGRSNGQARPRPPHSNGVDG